MPTTRKSTQTAPTHQPHPRRRQQCSSQTLPSWRIDHRHTSLDAELFAIFQAIIFIRTHLSLQRVVIYTDSKSSLQLLSSRKPSTARSLLYNIHELRRFLTGPGWEDRLQWVPSHVGIQGNEIADATARLALQTPVLEHVPPSPSIHVAPFAVQGLSTGMR